MSRPKYMMTIDLSVLNHLGIGLYSNIPAVLSEIVANAWDADAPRVSVTLDKENGEIVIYDEGRGMTEYDINYRYLKVGYRKRDEEPGETPGGRNPMGRKGIGKLSVFSIAKTVEVYSIKDGQRNALSMNSDAIKKKIQDSPEEGTYEPTILDSELVDFEKGTKIVLKDLNRNITKTTAKSLRQRLARRFSVIGEVNGFIVEIDGEQISVEDRGYYGKIEFLWHIGELEDLDHGFFGENSSKNELRPNIKEHFDVEEWVDEDCDYRASGWIGTIDEQRSVEEEYNTIVVFARGKLIHEDVLKDLNESGVYSKYLIGEIRADFMDIDGDDDIVTSDRQSVKQDDERYTKLKDFVLAILKRIQNQWTGLRVKVGTRRATEIPAVKEWYERLGGDSKKHAQSLFGKIESLHLPDATSKRELYKSSMLAFERLKLTDSLSALARLETEQDFHTLSALFGTIDDIEAVHYHEIARGRLQIIQEFRDITPDAKERVLQDHIFDHLWLLHPSWERAASNARVEEAVTTEFEKIKTKLTEPERSGRIDIRYTTAAGKHIIVELKKYDRDVSTADLIAQISKYRSALRKCLNDRFPLESQVIECICILGKPPQPRDDKEENIQALSAYNTRYLTYDQLIQEAIDSYDEYLIKHKEVSELQRIIEKLDEPSVEIAEPANS